MPERPFEFSLKQREAVAQALAKINVSHAFVSSERHQRLLRYLVEQTLAGKANRLNQYAIAIDVLARDATFDPSTDSAVRVEIGRLRAKLHEYYDTEGSGDEVRITLPRGKYVPAIGVEKTAPAEPLNSEAGPALPGNGATLPSVAVLPFVNMSADPEQEYFSDGISEEILNALYRVEGLHVVARTSAFSFKHREIDIKEIGRTLMVGHVIEGSVRRTGDRLRITAQLISVEDGFIEWSQSYDRGLTDLFEVQEDIATSVVEALRVTLNSDRETQLAVPSNKDMSAYDALLKGRYAMRVWNLPAFAKAVNYFEQAVAVAPDYAEAYGFLAYALTMSTLYCPYYDFAQQAQENVERSLELNPNQPEALSAKSYLSWPQWELVQALLDRALAGASDHPVLIQHYTRAYLAPLCRFEEALRMLEIAQMKDPLSPMVEHARARVLFHCGDLEGAVTACERCLDIEAGNYPACYLSGELYARLGDIKAADRILARLQQVSGDDDPFRRYVEGLTHLARGRADLAQETRRQLIEQWAITAPPYVPPYLIGQLSIAMEEIEQGLHWFETAWYERDFFLCDLRAHYRNSPEVWNHPGAERIARQMNLDDDRLNGL